MNRLFFDYSFKNWRELSNENTDPMDYRVKGIDDILADQQNNSINSLAGWERKKEDISTQIEWMLGDEPEGVTNPGQGSLDRGYAVFSFDMLGFGNRIEKGTRFYHRYPRWSKMGKMVTDARGCCGGND